MGELFSGTRRGIASVRARQVAVYAVPNMQRRFGAKLPVSGLASIPLVHSSWKAKVPR
jgi:hypothetical protein